MGIMRNSQSLIRVAIVFSLLSLHLCPACAGSGSDYNYRAHPRFVCAPVPVDVDPSCFPTAGPGTGAAGLSRPGHQSAPPAGWWGASEEAKATILHLRESLVQQKEAILEQRETIRELTAKLTLCEGSGRGMMPHGEHHGAVSQSHHAGVASHHTYHGNGHYSNQQSHHGNSNLMPDSTHNPAVAGQRPVAEHSSSNQRKDKHVTPGDITSSPEHMERMLQALKERLDNLQKRNTSMAYSSSLKELLQNKISALEQQRHHRTTVLRGPEHHGDDSSHRDDGDHHEDDHPDDHKDDHSNGGYSDSGNYTDHGRTSDHAGGDHDDDQHSSNRKKSKSPDTFQISFPMKTNYMYGQVKRTLLQEIFALTLCLWMKTGVGPGLGTPFSYSAPGQANELVLIEWGNNPIELLVDDKSVMLPLSLADGKWHHMCVTWSTRDGQWEAYQDGLQKGSGNNLSSWHSVKPGGVFILGQEQDTLGGRFDATQSFVGEMSDLHMWSHVLSANDIYSLASCSSHLRGDIIAWSDTEVELHGGVARYPFDLCH
uniref:Pentraxin (PTX) domain-containing protein n=1 Tax=Monopterus albus TaxID=43700 RepID=A0A3Q3J3I4_MONAL